MSAHLKPTKYCKTSPIQMTGAEIPISTNTIAPLSKSERGLKAERMPIGRAISIHRIDAAEDE